MISDNPLRDMYPALWHQARALVILKILFDFSRPVLRKELVNATHGDGETITYYLNSLATMGLVTRVYGRSGFALTAQGFEFMRPDRAEVPSVVVPLAADNCMDNSSSKTEKPFSRAEKPFLKTARTVLKDGILPLSTSTTTTKNIDSEVVVEVKGKNSVFESGNLAFFAEIGITENERTKFIAQHIEPERVREEWEKLQAKGKPWPGLLIKILGSLPKEKSRAEKEAEARRRYGAWDQERRDEA
jgi:hypothetical protein